MEELYKFIKELALKKEVSLGNSDFSKYIDTVEKMEKVTKKLTNYMLNDNLSEEEKSEVNFLEVELDKLEGELEFLDDIENLLFEKEKSIENLLSSPELIYEVFYEALKKI